VQKIKRIHNKSMTKMSTYNFDNGDDIDREDSIDTSNWSVGFQPPTRSSIFLIDLFFVELVYSVFWGYWSCEV
jgi:hypothetical protein